MTTFSSSSAAIGRVSKRLMLEIQSLERDPPPSIAAWPVKESNLHQLHAQICGPVDSPYEHGLFKLAINIPDSYPLTPPIITFMTPIYHPNIDTAGRICLDTLNLPPKGCWSPSLTLAATLISITQLMKYPNGKDGLMQQVTDLFNRDIQHFNTLAKEWTRKYAINATTEDTTTINTEDKREQEQKKEGETDSYTADKAKLSPDTVSAERPSNEQTPVVSVPAANIPAVKPSTEHSGSRPDPPDDDDEDDDEDDDGGSRTRYISESDDDDEADDVDSAPHKKQKT